MKLFGNKNLKIMAATMMTIFSLASVFMGTFAWFLANRNINSDFDDFQSEETISAIKNISFHEYYFRSDDGYYGFNPIPYSYLTYNESTKRYQSSNPSPLELGEYSLDDQHHPALILCEIGGSVETIKGKTNFPYIAQTKPGAASVTTYATKALLLAAAKPADGTVVEVTKDESIPSRNEVDEDEYESVTTRYQYDASSDTYKLVWTALAKENNALSSIVEFHSFTFEWASPYVRNGNNYTINNECTGLASKSYTDAEEVVHTQNNGLWIPVSEFVSANRSSFVSSTDGFAAHAELTPEITIFSGSVINKTYIGIVVDYYPDALEYLSSYFMSNPLLNEGLTFKCDWITIV